VKCHWPDAFLASLLNSQPMGFYQPAQLVRDAREHGVEVRGPDVLASDWDCTLEPASKPGDLRAVRLGLRQIKGFNEKEAGRLMEARGEGVRSIEDFAVRAGLSRRSLELLAEADAFASLGLPRRQALWVVKGLSDETGSLKDAPLLAAMGVKERPVDLPLMTTPHEVQEDYRTTSLSLRAHPVSFFRSSLDSLGAVKARDLKDMRDRRLVTVGGLVLVRQRPGTAKGVTFMTLEDETGVANIVIWQDAFTANRRLVMTSSFLVVHGQVQSESNVVHVVARRFTDLSHRLAEMKAEEGQAPRIHNRVTGGLIRSRDFH
jgi:error-prone DNA polymerase